MIIFFFSFSRDVNQNLGLLFSISPADFLGNPNAQVFFNFLKAKFLELQISQLYFFH